MLLYLFIQLATSFGHSDHHQANIQKYKMLTILKMLVCLSLNMFLWDPIYMICYYDPYKYSFP